MPAMMRVFGFTLVELLVALAIMAVIAAVVMPLYSQYSLRAFRSEGQADLMGCAQGLERFAAVNFNYLLTADTDGDGSGDADTGPVANDICSPRSVAQGRYTIAVNATATEFELTATPVGRMVGNGFMTFDSTGRRSWDQDDSGDIDVDEQDWTE